jgi:hypothetical protein
MYMGFVQFFAPWGDGSGNQVEEHAKVVGFSVEKVQHIAEPAITDLLAKAEERS